RLAPSVVPDVAGVAVAQRAAGLQQGLQHEGEVLALGVEARLAVAGAQRMLVQDDEAEPALAPEALQAPGKVDFLSGIERLVEAADRAERVRPAEDEGSGCPLYRAAE